MSTTPPRRSESHATNASATQIFLPLEVRRSGRSSTSCASTLISVLAYAGPGPKRLCAAVRGVPSANVPSDTTTKSVTAFASRRFSMSSPRIYANDSCVGRPDATSPVFPAHDGGFWDQDDWRNWRSRAWLGRRERATVPRRQTPRRPGGAPAGTRPRDLRSSYITLRVYEGIPLTTISKEVGTGVQMIEKRYAVENWTADGCPRRSKSAPRDLLGDAQWTLRPINRGSWPDANSLEKATKPTPGIEPGTPSLRVAHLQGFCCRYRHLILVRAGWMRSELPGSGHGSGHAFQVVVGTRRGRSWSATSVGVAPALKLMIQSASSRSVALTP